MPPLRLVADDLTGALDSAAPFCQAHGSLPVYLRAPNSIPHGTSAALTLNVRDLSATETRKRSQSARSFLRDANPAFLKIDSLLRGHPEILIDSFADPSDFSHTLIAPAFPDQGRLTRDGVQRFVSGNPVPAETEQKLVSKLQDLGHNPQLFSHPHRHPESLPKMILCDAASNHELHTWVAWAKALPAPVLWVGTSGLARALTSFASSPSLSMSKLPTPLLVILGTRHPVTQQQLAHLVNEKRVRHLVLSPDLPQRSSDTLTLAFQGSSVVVLTFALPKMTEGEALEQLHAMLSRILSPLSRPKSLLVSGGATLALICDILGCHALQVEGEWQAGFPVAKLNSGSWVGTKMISKSGAFGHPRVLTELLDHHLEAR